VGESVNPFTTDGQWLRCALHAHTTNSDGDMPPDKLAAHYERAGYDVLAITDHWVRTEERSSERLLVMASAELNAQAGGPAEDSHVLALGISADPVLPDTEFASLEETVAWIRANDGIPYLAHSYWSGLRPEQFEAVEGLVGLEVWNAGCELELGRGDACLHWDELLERGTLLYGLATDDSHHPGFDSGRAWVWLKAPERSREAVLDALATGCFYGSTGPEIRTLSVEDERVALRCSPAASVTLYAGRRSGARVNAGALGYPHEGRVLERDDDGLITSVELRRPWRAPYGRVEVADAAGRRAWSNPLWI